MQIEEPLLMKQLLAERKPFLLAHWHGDELVLISLAKRYRIATITSTSKDGELMNQVLIWLGAATSRGSSTRGAVGALKGLLKLMKKGHNASFAVDGPKGPLHRVKPGVFEVAKLLSCPIFYAGVHTSQKKVFNKSWNKTFLPYPFAQIQIVWEGPVLVDQNQDPRQIELAKSLESGLHHCHERAKSLDPSQQ